MWCATATACLLVGGYVQGGDWPSSTASEVKPLAPASLKAKVVKTSVDLSWAAPVNNGLDPVQSYVVYEFSGTKTKDLGSLKTTASSTSASLANCDVGSTAS